MTCLNVCVNDEVEIECLVFPIIIHDRPNKINVFFPVTCWEKRGSDGRKNNLSETKTNSQSLIDVKCH